MTSLESIMDGVQIAPDESDEHIGLQERRVDAKLVRTMGHEANVLPMRYESLHASEESMRNLAILIQASAMSMGVLLVEDENAAPLSEEERRLISATLAASGKKPKK